MPRSEARYVSCSVCQLHWRELQDGNTIPHGQEILETASHFHP